MRRSLFLALAFSVSVVPVAQAQNVPADLERVDRLERDIQLLQRQISRRPVNPNQPGGGPVETSPVVENPAQLDVKLTAIEDELRGLRGKVEENEFQVKKLSETLDKFQKDTEFRFNELGKQPGAGAADTTAPTAATDKPADAAATAPDGPTTAGDGVLRADAPSADEFSTPRDLYNHAFRLLNQTKYEDAAAAFAAFTRKFAKDPLVGNAYYWAGETFYIRRDYVNAADQFRQGFEALPDGPKAADNLLKLAMSLDALNRSKEACVVLQQITTKFKKASTNITEKAAKEQKRIGCQ